MNGRAGRFAVSAALLFLALAFAHSAAAHSRSQSFSNWHLGEDGALTAHFSVLAREVTRLVPVEGARRELDDLFAAHLERTTRVRTDKGPCVPTGAQPVAARSGHVRADLRFACAAGSDVEIDIEGFFEVAPSHVHFSRIRRGQSTPVEYLYTDASRRHRVPAPGKKASPSQSGGATFVSYVELGVEHILGGLDHVAFLLALLLLSRRLRDVVLMVTGFTVGHSITLTLAALGVLRPNVAVIEALIGFTIAVVALECVAVATGASRRVSNVTGGFLAALAVFALVSGQGPPLVVLLGLSLFSFCYLRITATRTLAMRFAPLVTVLFGLIHGFGFASVLIEIGLPAERLVPALFGFNIGVEVGQLAIVAALFLLASMVVPRMAPARLRLGEDLLAAALCGVGLFWFVERSFSI